MSALQERFETAVREVQQVSDRPGNEDLLRLYGLYKQATQGDVEGRRPGFTDFKGRAKYDAWASVRAISREDAMSEYVELVARLQGD